MSCWRAVASEMARLQPVVVGNARLAAEARRPGETRAENPSEVIVDVVVEQNEVDSLAPDQRPQAPQLWELCEQEPHSKTRRHLRALKKSPSRRSEEKSEGHVLLRLGGRREKVHAHTELADAPRIGSVVGEVERNDRLESRFFVPSDRSYLSRRWARRTPSIEPSGGLRGITASRRRSRTPWTSCGIPRPFNR